MKNKQRLLIAFLFALPSAFVVKGQESRVANQQITILNQINNKSNILAKQKQSDGSYLTLAKRTINQRGLERQNVGEQYTSKFTPDQLPKEGYAFAGDRTELYNELKDVLYKSKEKVLSQGVGLYYAGGEFTYSKSPLSSDIKSVDSTLAFPMDGFTYPLGLYAAPGETVTLLVPTNFEEQLFSDTLDNTLYFNIGVTGTESNLQYGIERLGLVESSKNNLQTFPLRVSRFNASEIFSKENTVVKDGQRFFEGKIASPLGGPIYVQSASKSSETIQVRATGAIESRLYILGSTTDSENQENYENSAAPYYDIVTPSMRFSSEFVKTEELETKNFANFAQILQSMQSINYFLDKDYGRQIVLQDRFAVNSNSGWGSSNIAYITSGYNFAVAPKYSVVTDYKQLMTNLTKIGSGYNYLYNYQAQYHNYKGTNVRFGLNPNLGGVPNIYHSVVQAYQDSLLSDYAKTRVDASLPLESSGAYTDPYTNLLGSWSNQFGNYSSSVHNVNIYTTIFHSIGLGTLAEMNKFAWNSAQWKESKITNADDVLRGLTYYSGFDFTNYVKNTIRADVSDAVVDEIQNKICGDTNQACDFPKFAATGSLYTRSNERVKDLNQWRQDIKSNVEKNGIPSYYSEKESLESSKYTASFTQASEYVLEGGTSTTKGIEKNVYKRNTTGNNFKIDSKKTTTLNLNPTYTNDNSTYKLNGRIASTEKIKNITLEWQEGNAISDNGDYTYSVDPTLITSNNNLYNFAVSVQYEDEKIPTEILYGKLEKDNYTLQAKHYSAKNITVTNSNYKSPFDQFDFDSKKLDEELTLLDTSNSDGTLFKSNNVTDKSNGVISVLDFDLHLPAGSTWVGLSPTNCRAVLAQRKEDGTSEFLIYRGKDVPNSGDKEFNFDKPTVVSLTLFMYTTSAQNGSLYLGMKDNATNIWTATSKSMVSKNGEEPTPEVEDIPLKDQPFTGHNFTDSNTNDSDQQYTKNDISLISYGYFEQGHTVSSDLEDSKAFNNQYFTKYNKYDKNISEADAKTLKTTEKTISDNNYLTTSSKATAIKYENMDANYGALYFTYENIKNKNINQVILRDEQNADNNKFSYVTDTLGGTIGDVSIYVGDELDANGSPVLSKYTKVKTDINNKTWKVDLDEKGNIVQSIASYYGRTEAANRVIDLDKDYSNKYIVVKVENGQSYDGQKNASFKIAEISFHSYINLGSEYIDTIPTNENIKRFGSWKETTDETLVKKTILTGNQSAYLGFSFTGSALTISGNKYSGAGKLKLTIDGTSYVIDTNNDKTISDTILFNQKLENKNHLVTIEVLEGDIQLTRIGFDSDKFNSVSDQDIKNQVGVKDPEPEQPSEPENPTGPNNNTNGSNKALVISLSVLGGILGAAAIGVSIFLIVKYTKKKKEAN